MKYWKRIIKEGLTYAEAKEQIKQGYYVTRPEWEGVHYEMAGKYRILLKDGTVIKPTEEEIWDKDKNDWMVVAITKEAVYATFDEFLKPKRRE